MRGGEGKKLRSTGDHLLNGGRQSQSEVIGEAASPRIILGR